MGCSGDINDYSPIYDEYDWTSGGDVYALGNASVVQFAFPYIIFHVSHVESGRMSVASDWQLSYILDANAHAFHICLAWYRAHHLLQKPIV